MSARKNLNFLTPISYRSPIEVVYQKELSKLPPVVDSDLEGLFMQYHSGDLAARDKIIHSCLRLVTWVARRMARAVPGSNSDDLISEGNIGLMEAVDKFDPSRGSKFSVFAVWYIRRSISAYLYYQNDSALGKGRYRYSSKVKAEIERLTQALERIPTVDEVADAMDMDVEAIDRQYSYFCEGKTIQGYDMDDIATTESMEEETRDEQRVILKEMISELKPKEAKVVSMLFGIDQEPMHQDDIAEECDVCLDYVHVLKRRALTKLKELWQKQT